MKFRDYITERRIIRDDRRKLRRLFCADFQFTRMFDDAWKQRRRMTEAGWKRK